MVRGSTYHEAQVKSVSPISVEPIEPPHNLTSERLHKRMRWFEDTVRQSGSRIENDEIVSPVIGPTILRLPEQTWQKLEAILVPAADEIAVKPRLRRREAGKNPGSVTIIHLIKCRLRVAARDVSHRLGAEGIADPATDRPGPAQLQVSADESYIVAVLARMASTDVPPIPIGKRADHNRRVKNLGGKLIVATTLDGPKPAPASLVERNVGGTGREEGKVRLGIIHPVAAAPTEITPRPIGSGGVSRGSLGVCKDQHQ